MITWIFLIVGAVLLLFGVTSGISTYSWLRDAQSVSGTVVALVGEQSRKKGSDHTYAPRVRYEIDGVEREFVSSQSSSTPDFKVGQQVIVASNLQMNQECIATFGELYGFSLVASLLGFAMLAATACFMNGSQLIRILHPHLA